MDDDMIAVSPACRNCGAALSLAEMHYFDGGDGTATCNECERKWSQDMTDWRNGHRNDMPKPP